MTESRKEIKRVERNVGNALLVLSYLQVTLQNCQQTPTNSNSQVILGAGCVAHYDTIRKIHHPLLQTSSVQFMDVRASLAISFLQDPRSTGRRPIPPSRLHVLRHVVLMKLQCPVLVQLG